MQEPTFHTLHEAAEILRVDAATIYRSIRKGSFPAAESAADTSSPLPRYATSRQRRAPASPRRMPVVITSETSVPQSSSSANAVSSSRAASAADGGSGSGAVARG